jgi:hypothetical protein
MGEEEKEDNVNAGSFEDNSNNVSRERNPVPAWLKSSKVKDIKKVQIDIMPPAWLNEEYLKQLNEGYLERVEQVSSTDTSLNETVQEMGVLLDKISKNLQAANKSDIDVNRLAKELEEIKSIQSQVESQKASHSVALSEYQTFVDQKYEFIKTATDTRIGVVEKRLVDLEDRRNRSIDRTMVIFGIAIPTLVGLITCFISAVIASIPLIFGTN